MAKGGPVATVKILCAGFRAGGMETVPLNGDSGGVGPRVGRRLSRGPHAVILVNWGIQA